MFFEKIVERCLFSVGTWFLPASSTETVNITSLSSSYHRAAVECFNSLSTTASL